MKKRSDYSKLFYIPSWRTGAMERELAEYARCGYKPVDFQETLFSIWRITFRKSEPHSTDYYLFGRFQGGRGQTRGYFSPCGKEERKISTISRRTLIIGANLLVAELRPDADPDTVAKCRVEKMKAARKLYASFFLLEILAIPSMILILFIAMLFCGMPLDTIIQRFQPSSEFPTELLPYTLLPIYAAIATVGCSNELKRLTEIK